MVQRQICKHEMNQKVRQFITDALPDLLWKVLKDT